MSTWLTENQLRERFRVLFEHNPAAVVAIDEQLRISDVNPAGLRIIGYRRDDIVGQRIVSFAPPTQHEMIDGMLRRALAGETVHFRSDAYAADGRLIAFMATIMPLQHDSGIAGAYAILENVTDRLRAERTVEAQREELIDLEHDLHELFEKNPDAIVVLDCEGRIVELNEATARLGGVPREQILNQNFRVFLQGPDLERGWAFFRRALDGETVRYDITARSFDGRELLLDVTHFPKHQHNAIAGTYCIIQDTTERRASQRKAEMQAQRVRDLYLLATTPEYTDAHVMSTLQTGCRLLGVESGAIVEVGDTPQVEMRYDALELFAGVEAPLVDIAQRVLNGREAVSSQSGGEPESTYRSWIGTRLTVGGKLHGVLIFFSQSRRTQAFEEIDHDTLLLMSALVGAALERRRTRSHLRTLAYYDSLTGLPNRLFFQERLRDALIDAEGNPKAVAVAFFDIDRFKDINDSLGHAMGDRFLQMVAHRLVDAVGSDGLVARMGGDEFIVMLEIAQGTTAVEPMTLDLLRTIERPYRLDGYEQYLSASAGISVYPDDARDDQTLIKHADIAMYQAKERGGGGHLFYSHSFEEPLRLRLNQEQHLRRAIDRDELVLHFQPVFDVKTLRIAGVEALVRWQDAERGTIYPDHFIPTAEASGLIVQIGHWVIAEAARCLADFTAGDAAPLQLAINVSARQFHEPDLAERMIGALRDYGIDPSLLEVEITESMAISNITHAMETLRQLKRLGASISVDDFGTGHSSLNYLRRFDVDEIKIDRSFVAGIGSALSDESIVTAIIAMGHSLGIRIVAEGVETKQQFEFLRAHGCDRVQGYYFSRPLTAEALKKLLPARETAPGSG